MKWSRYFSCFLFLLLVSLANGQSHNYSLISTEDGLPSNHVYNVLTDTKGYTWFATNRGVAKYDGHTMKVFTTSDGLPANDVWKLWEDSKGRIWLHAFTREMVFIENDSIVVGWEREFPDSYWPLMEEDGVVYSIDHKNFYRYPGGVEPLVEKKGRASYFCLSNFQVLTITQTGVADSAVVTIHKYISGKNPNSREFKVATTFLDRPTGFVLPYISIDNYLFVYVAKTGLVKRLDLETSEVKELSLNDTWPNVKDIVFRKIDDHILLSSGYGCLNLSLDMKIIDQFESLGIENDNLGDYAYQNRDGDIFIARKGKGVYLLPKQKKNTIHIPFTKNSKGIYFLGLSVKNSLLVGRRNGSVYELVDGQFAERIKGNEIIDSWVRDVVFWKDMYWVSRQKSGLTFYDEEFRKLSSLAWMEKVKYELNGKAKESYKNVSLTSKYLNIFGNIKDFYLNKKLDWVSIASSGYSQLIRIDNDVINFDFYGPRRQYATVIQDTGVVWYGRMQGLSYLYQDSVIVLDSDSLYKKSINKLLLDNNQNLWVGTDGAGVYCYIEGKHPYQVPGCEKDIIVDMVLAPNGDVWLATNHGIKGIQIKGEPTSARVINVYQIEDGLSMLPSRILVTDSLLYAGTPSGVDIIKITKQRERPISPKLVVHGVYVDGKKQETLIRLKATQNNISIKYSGVSLASKKGLAYRYYVEQYTKDTVTTYDQVVHLSQLPPGNYRFLMFAEDYLGGRSQIERLDFYIAKPWYRRWWFYVGIFGFVGYIVYWMIMRSQANFEAKEQVKRRIAQLKLQALQSQMNPHFMFNALVAIQQFNQGNLEKGSYYLNGFARLMRLYLESSRLSDVSLKDELELIRLYVDLEMLRFDSRFDVVIDVEAGLDTTFIKIPSMILQPFVENAINHGLFHKKEMGHLKISVNGFNDDFVHVVIEDDGIGRVKAKEIAKKSKRNYKSRAMQIIEERLAILNYSTDSKMQIEIEDLYDENGIAEGTKIDIILPVLI